jgi:flagellar M-ring protein FliF
MDELKRLLSSLTLRQKISLVAAAILVMGGLYALSRWNRERDFQPLYTNLAPEDAGAVVSELRASGIEYRVTDGGSTILTPSAQVAETRLQMATSGLPRTGRIGFELFDQTSFGTTDFAEQVNYHRALEGELERSVTALAEVERSRVHLTLPKDSVFLESRRPAKASVMVKLRPGAGLSAQNVVAVCYLVSSAVEGLEPEAVSVLDMRGNLLNRARRPGQLDMPEPSEAILEYRRSIERNLLAKISSTLDPLLGPDGFRASASVECDFTSGEQSEEILDPNRSVMTMSETTEDISGMQAASGVPGTASNLPRPTSRPGIGGTGYTRKTENVAYQSSRTVRRVQLPQGDVKRMSVALLVDHAVRWEGSGEDAKRTLEAPSPEKLKSIRELVAGAIGLQTDRGDQLIIESLPFESTLNWKPPEEAPAAPPPSGLPLPAWLEDALKEKNMLVLAGIGAAAAVVLLLLVGFLLLMRRRKKRRVEAVSAGKAVSSGEAGVPALEEGPDVGEKMSGRLADQVALKARLEKEALESLKLPAVKTKKAEVLTKHIADEAKKDPGAMAQLVRTWLNEEE